MASKQRSGVSCKTQYKTYKDSGRWRKNKIKKLERRILANPEDKGAVDALDKFLKTTTKMYGRGKPGAKGWFAPQEAALLSKLKHDGKDTEVVEKLANLRFIHSSKWAASINKSFRSTQARVSIPDQLFEIGLINEKRKEVVNARVDCVRGR